MTWALVIWAAVVIALEGVIVGLVIWFVHKTDIRFGAYTDRMGAYTDALLRTHESNRTVHEFNVKLIDEMRKWREDQLKKGAA